MVALSFVLSYNVLFVLSYNGLPYVIGQAIIFSACGFCLLLSIY